MPRRSVHSASPQDVSTPCRAVELWAMVVILERCSCIPVSLFRWKQIMVDLRPCPRTLLLTDLVDSTRLTETLGDRRAADIGARHDRLARDLLKRHGGREMDKTDGFLLLFERPIDAVAYALDY